MEIKIKKSLFAYLFLFLLMLPAIGFSIGSMFIPYLFILEGVIFVLMLLFNRNFLNDIMLLCRKTPFLYMFLFFIWASFTVIVSMFQGTFYLKSFIFGYIGGLIFCVLCPLLFSYFINKNFVPAENFIKLYVIIYLFVFGLGIIEFIIKQYDLDLAVMLVSLFNNRRIGLSLGDGSLSLIWRIKSIFDEPAVLGEFIYLNIPIIFSLVLSKYKIFESKLFNKTIKLVLIPLTAAVLILTKSPITLVFTVIITLFYFYKNIIYTVKKYYLIITAFLLAVFLLFILYTLGSGVNINLEQSYLMRIVNTIKNMSSIHDLIDAEPSLATRIINYANNMLVFMKYPLFGTGYGNMSSYMVVQMQNTPLPLTQELWGMLIKQQGGIASAIFYKAAAETGIIGIILLFVFGIKTYLLNKKLIKISDGIIKDFLQGINFYLIVFMTFVFFYNSNLHSTQYWLIFGFIYAYSAVLRKRTLKHENHN